MNYVDLALRLANPYLALPRRLRGGAGAAIWRTPSLPYSLH
jgi:hypothetical protein